MKRRLAAALAVLAVTSTVAMPVSRVTAGPGDGTLTVKVVRDVNGNGAHEPALEIGVADASVVVTDPAGHTTTGTTKADGELRVDLGPVSGGKYRVQVSPPAGSVLQPAPAGDTLESNTMFVDVSSGQDKAVTTGLWNPADYCQNDPRLVTACQRDITTFNDDPGSRSLVTFPWTARGTITAASQLATQGTTGTVFGLAYQRDQKRVFSAAFAKRLAKYGTGDAGAIYVTPVAGGPTTRFTTVPNAGSTAHDMSTNADGAFFDVPGKESLGDVDLSEDGTELYVVNMNDKSLYVYYATGPTATAPKATYPIPSGACPSAKDWRPGALGVRDGTVWVGGVCSGESTQRIGDVRAVVYPFTNNKFGTAAVNKVLDFPRGDAAKGMQGAGTWHPWTPKWEPGTKGNSQAGFDPSSKNIVYPMPLLTDIGVETNGDLVLAFRDRFGDQVGQQTPAPDGTERGTTWNAVIGGDLNRACRTAGGTFEWEGSGACPDNRPAESLGGGEGNNVAEYYPGEYFDTYNNGVGNKNVRHAETSLGAVAVVHTEDRMPANVMDPVQVRTGGTGWFDRENGQMQTRDRSQSYEIMSETTEGWGKANGLADLEALCDLAPVQFGNRVWFDTDGDGAQDGGEPPVEGVEVTATACNVVAPPLKKTTNARGEYRFGGADPAGVTDDLLADTCYNLEFDYSRVDPARLPGRPALADLGWTTQRVVADVMIDSNVNRDGKTSVDTADAGTVQHSIDAGLTLVNKLGGFVWDDTDSDGERDQGEPGVQGVSVVLKGADGKQIGQPEVTNAQGGYLFDKLTDGTYKVCFDLSQLPGRYAGYGFTRKDAPGVANDSDADPADGCTATTTLRAGKREDRTLDAGIVPPDHEIGDLVWADGNRTGLREPSEPGVSGVAVTLKDNAGVVIGQPKTTDKDGGYLFDKLRSGTYQVCFGLKNLPAQYTSYLPTRADAGDDKDDSDAGSDGCTKPVSLGGSKRQDLTVDAGIRPPNELEGRVWDDTDKDGLRGPGEPDVPGVPVKLVDHVGKPVGNPARTGPDGRYEFPALPDGTYEVCFDLKNLPASVAGYWVSKPNAGDDGADSDAEVATGCTPRTTLNIDNPKKSALDVGLVPPVNRLGDLVWLDADKNGKQDPGEKPVPDVTVKLNTGATTKTDGSGGYLFDDLPDGTYTVCFDLAKLPTAVADFTATRANAGHDGEDSDVDPTTGCVPPTPLAGKHENLSLDLGLVAPPNRLGDRVWVDANNNGVQDSGEQGVPNMPVKLSMGPSTTTDGTGSYLFPDLPDGEHEVCFGPMPQQFSGYQFTKPDKGDDGKDSDVEASGCAHEVELGVGKRENLTVDAGIRQPVNRLGDTVWIDSNSNGLQDATEQPVPDVTVRLNTGVTTKTGPTGKYLFDDLPDDLYYVCFDTTALPPPVADYRFTRPDAGDGGPEDAIDSDAGPATGCSHVVSLGKDKREDLTLDAGLVAPPNKIGDRVWSDRNHNGIQDLGEPGVPGVPVALVDGAGRPVGDPTRTGPDGQYEFPDIPDGTYAVCFEMTGLPDTHVGWLATKPNAGDGSRESDERDSDADLASGCSPPVVVGVGKRDIRTLDLGLVPPANRVGDRVWSDENSNGIQDPAEPGVPNLPVYLQDGTGKPIAATETDSDGKYLFTNLADGEYQVCFNADPRTHLIEGRRLTQPNAGGGVSASDSRDSDADPASGCTHVVRLGKDTRVDMSLDAGLLPTATLASTGMFRWSLLAIAVLLLLGGGVLAFVASDRRKTT